MSKKVNFLVIFFVGGMLGFGGLILALKLDFPWSHPLQSYLGLTGPDAVNVRGAGRQGTVGRQGKAGQTGQKVRKILYWVAPMDPSYRRDKPGKSPMGMDLIPVYADQVAGGTGTVRIDPSLVNNLGVRTVRVKYVDLSREFRTIGEVTYDERRVSHVHTRISGWVEKLYVDAPGDRVEKGSRILSIYSPDLVTAQEEYLLALKRVREFKRSRIRLQDSLLSQARERLLLFGVSANEIKALEASGRYKKNLVLRSPRSGIVTELGVREGMWVTPAKNLYTIADLSRVWVMADVFQYQAQWITKGDRVLLRLSYVPGKIWQGTIDYVYPYLTRQTRTLKARLVFANPRLELKPYMYANLRVMAAPKRHVLAIPREALIKTGKRAVVVVDLGEGRFRPLDVVPGIESGGLVEIKQGLVAGQDVVVSAQFLLDSESNLQAALTRMTSGGSTPDAANMTGGDRQETRDKMSGMDMQKRQSGFGSASRQGTDDMSAMSHGGGSGQKGSQSMEGMKHD